MEFTDEMLKSIIVPGKGLPVYLDQRSPEIEDPSQKLGPHHWQPACASSSKLTRCLEAVRDVAAALAPLSALHRPGDDKRLVKQAIPPVYNLAIAIRDLYNYVQSNCWKKLHKQKQRELAKGFKKFGEIVPTGCGVLKTARDKIAAHLDKDLCTTEYRKFWDSFCLADVLVWIKGCLKMLRMLISPDIYSWTRFSGYSNIWNLMNVDGSEVSLLIKDDKPEAIVGVQFTVSPKAGIAREVRDLIATCVALDQRLSEKEDYPSPSG